MATEQMKALLGMYSLRREMAQDLYGTLEQAQRLGFDGIELAWYAGHPVERVQAAVRALGLDVWACHTDVEEMLRGPQRIFEQIAGFGARYVVICHMSAAQRPGGALFARTQEQVASLAQCARTQYGLQMLYHNHAFDLEPLPDGGRSLDASYAAFPVGGELDTCWVEISGASTVEYLARYAGRIPLVHLKDYRRADTAAGAEVPAAGYDFCPLGQGLLDVEGIACAAADSGVRALILELDEPGRGLTPQAAVEQSAKALMRVLGR